MATALATTTPDFGTLAKQANLVPLWEQTTLHQLGEPRSPPSCHWSWRAVQPLIDRAVEETSTAKAERRVLLLSDPSAAGVAVGPTLQGGLQILMPGEEARPHRHTPNALRFVIEDGGSSTIVDGKECRMERGDMILTPANTWHAHVSRGPGRTVWLDVLDSALNAYLDAGFFEGGPVADYPITEDEAQFTSAGYGRDFPAPHSYSPMFRYPWATARDALQRLPLEADGTRVMRYTNVATGGPVMSLMECMLMEAGHTESYPTRSTASAVCIVAQGSGWSQIGTQRIAWQENDIFTLPRWSWTSHKSEGDGAILFVVTDREILRRLDLLRVETGGPTA